MKTLAFSITLCIALASCTTLKPYERQYVNDAEMSMDDDSGEGFNNYVHSIREASTPPASTKGNGGCGCN